MSIDAGKVECPDCDAGTVYENCSYCGGSGEEEVECERCEGTGEIDEEDED